MSLNNIYIQKRKIKVGKDQEGNNVFVEARGLNSKDFALLLENQQEVLEILLNGFNFNDEENIQQNLLSKFPLFCYLVISLGIDEPQEIETISKLSFVTQLELLSNVINLTFPEGIEEAKKQIVASIQMLTGSNKSTEEK